MDLEQGGPGFSPALCLNNRWTEQDAEFVKPWLSTGLGAGI